MLCAHYSVGANLWPKIAKDTESAEAICIEVAATKVFICDLKANAAHAVALMPVIKLDQGTLVLNQ